MDENKVTDLRIRDFRRPQKTVNPQARPYFERMTREAVQMEYLTHTGEWDLYLSYVQGLISKTEANKLTVDQMLTDGPVFDHIRLLELKTQSMLLAERLFTLNQLLEIPKVIKEEGSKGLDYLSSLKDPEGEAKK